jgi:hypothetical protein
VLYCPPTRQAWHFRPYRVAASGGANCRLNRRRRVSQSSENNKWRAREIINKSKVPGGNISFDAISAACWGARKRERHVFSSVRRPMFRQDVALLSPAEQEEEGAPAKVIAAAVLMPLLFRVFRRLLQDAPLLSHSESERAHGLRMQRDR